MTLKRSFPLALLAAFLLATVMGSAGCAYPSALINETPDAVVAMDQEDTEAADVNSDNKAKKKKKKKKRGKRKRR